MRNSLSSMSYENLSLWYKLWVGGEEISGLLVIWDLNYLTHDQYVSISWFSKVFLQVLEALHTAMYSRTWNDSIDSCLITIYIICLKCVCVQHNCFLQEAILFFLKFHTESERSGTDFMFTTIFLLFFSGLYSVQLPIERRSFSFRGRY